MQNFSHRLASKLTVTAFEATRPEGGIAQLVERGLCKAEVRGSNPLASTLTGVGNSTVEYSAFNRTVLGSNPSQLKPNT